MIKPETSKIIFGDFMPRPKLVGLDENAPFFMLKIEEELIKMGFSKEYVDTFSNGSILVILDKSQINIFVRSRQTSSEDYAQPCLGVQSLDELNTLCRLVNGLVTE